MPYHTAAPLTDEEIIELDNFLLAASQEEERLTVDEAHGFVTALVAGHESLPQEEWMEVVWGQPEFADETEQQRMISLLSRLHRDVSATLQAGGTFEPLVAEVEEDDETIIAIEGWCFGFMLAVSRNEERWNQLPKDEQALLAPIAKLALLETENAPEMDDEECESLAEMLPGSVVGLYSYWKTNPSH